MHEQTVRHSAFGGGHGVYREGCTDQVHVEYILATCKLTLYNCSQASVACQYGESSLWLAGKEVQYCRRGFAIV